jgi:hypothetical protein
MESKEGRVQRGGVDRPTPPPAAGPRKGPPANGRARIADAAPPSALVRGLGLEGGEALAHDGRGDLRELGAHSL